MTNYEKATISERADEAGLPCSGYLRALGLNIPVRSVVDLKAVADLAKVNGDLGRLAGLLKLWLAEQRGEGASALDVERVMAEFRELQSIVREKMALVVEAHR